MRRLVLVLLVAAVALAAALAWLTRDGPPARPAATLAVAAALGGPAEGYARAEAPRPFVFPGDHGPHPEFRTEWWYFTGNLATAAGRPFGFQLTFFRIALAPEGEPRASAWATRHVFMGHLALTDIAGGRFHPHVRLARGALGLAGAQAGPVRVWLEDWTVEAEPGALFPLRLRAAEDEVALDLVLEAGKPVVLQGDRGLSRKGPEPGNASFYYSFTRLPATGRLRLAGETHEVRGTAWMDREWSTSALGPDVAGWDWFALQLDDGRELMYYRLRQRDGSADPFSAGALVAADGSARALARDDVRLDVLATWESPVDGTRYPARWRLAVPGEGLALEVSPRLADQEFRGPVRYWEGAVAVTGRAGERVVSGVGYVELVGYAEAAASPGQGRWTTPPKDVEPHGVNLDLAIAAPTRRADCATSRSRRPTCTAVVEFYDGDGIDNSDNRALP